LKNIEVEKLDKIIQILVETKKDCLPNKDK